MMNFMLPVSRLMNRQDLVDHQEIAKKKKTGVYKNRRDREFNLPAQREWRSAYGLRGTNLVDLTLSRNGSKRTSILLTGFKLTLLSCFMMALITPRERVRVPLNGIDILRDDASVRFCLATYR